MTLSTSPNADPAPSKSARFTGPGWRFATLVLLVVAMTIPLMAISLVIEDRVQYQRSALAEVSQQWGGPVRLKGPAVVIPTQVTQERTVRGRDGADRIESYAEAGVPILLMPESLEISAESTSEIRTRGIFDVPVYSTDIAMTFQFDWSRVAEVVGPRESVLWDKAVLTVAMPRTRSFSGAAVLTTGGERLDLEPGSPIGQGGIRAALGDPRGTAAFSLNMGLNGADELMFTPTGRLTVLELSSDWPDPSFAGAFLPASRSISDEGFSARWEIPHLARDIPQVMRGDGLAQVWFGVRFYTPVDVYQRVQRATKYGVLFIALTFLTVFLTERLSARPAHPAQLVLIGVAQCVFFLLLLSFAEQIGFGPAYLGASGATIGLISVYGAVALSLGHRWWVLTVALAVLYGVLYLILKSTDYALLAGSLLAFVAVALAMLLTRQDRWGVQSTPA